MRSAAVFALFAAISGAEAFTFCWDYNASNCPAGAGCEVTGDACDIGGCDAWRADNCPTNTGCKVVDSACALDDGTTKGCSDYTQDDCPTNTGCIVDGNNCILFVEKTCPEYDTNATCSADTMCIFKEGMCEYKKCAEYTVAECPTAATDLCIEKDSACATKGCSDYPLANCPTTTGCVKENSECKLPGGGTSGCTLDWRMGCSDYTKECCPTSTGCTVVNNKCALDVPGETCTVKVGYGCNDYTYECCPVDTGCVKMNNLCMLPGSSTECPTEIRGCDGYVAACCPVSTGCAISLDGRCTYAALSVVGMTPVTSDSRSSCLSSCPMPVSYDNMKLMCSYFTCLKETASCAPILATVRNASSFATVQCACDRPVIGTFITALAGNGSCSGSEKLGGSVDLCKATGACKDALKAGIEALDTEADCHTLMKQLEGNTPVEQVTCAFDMVDSTGNGKGDGKGDSTGDGKGDSTGDGKGDSTGDGKGDSTGDGDGDGQNKGTASVAPKAAQAGHAVLAAAPLLWLLCG